MLEKGSAVGAQILSGCVMEPGPLDALLPEWRESPPAICVPAARDEFRLLTRRRSWWMPNPPQMHNAGTFIVSLGLLAAWMATRAEALGVDVFPGFAAAEALYADDGRVRGVRIGDMGLNKDGTPGPNHTPGAEIHAGTTVLAEGFRVRVTKQVISKLELSRNFPPPTFWPGFKELCQRPAGRAEPGPIRHTIGWPL